MKGVIVSKQDSTDTEYFCTWFLLSKSLSTSHATSAFCNCKPSYYCSSPVKIIQSLVESRLI